MKNIIKKAFGVLSIISIVAVVIFIVDVIRELSKPTFGELLEERYLKAHPEYTKADLDAAGEKVMKEALRGYRTGNNGHQASPELYNLLRKYKGESSSPTAPSPTLSKQMFDDMAWAKKQNKENKELLNSQLGEKTAADMHAKTKSQFQSKRIAFREITLDYNLSTRQFNMENSKRKGAELIVHAQISKEAMAPVLMGTQGLTEPQCDVFISSLKKSCIDGYLNTLSDQDIYCLCLMFSMIETNDTVNTDGVNIEEAFGDWSQKTALQTMQQVMNQSYLPSVAIAKNF